MRVKALDDASKWQAFLEYLAELREDVVSSKFLVYSAEEFDLMGNINGLELSDVQEGVANNILKVCQDMLGKQYSEDKFEKEYGVKLPVTFFAVKKEENGEDDEMDVEGILYVEAQEEKTNSTGKNKGEEKAQDGAQEEESVSYDFIDKGEFLDSNYKELEKGASEDAEKEEEGVYTVEKFSTQDGVRLDSFLKYDSEAFGEYALPLASVASLAFSINDDWFFVVEVDDNMNLWKIKDNEVIEELEEVIANIVLHGKSVDNYVEFDSGQTTLKLKVEFGSIVNYETSNDELSNLVEKLL